MKIVIITLFFIALIFIISIYAIKRLNKRLNETFYYTAPGVRYCRKCNAEQINSKRRNKDVGTWVNGRGMKAAIEANCDCLKWIN